jgi:hypothetical protein
MWKRSNAGRGPARVLRAAFGWALAAAFAALPTASARAQDGAALELALLLDTSGSLGASGAAARSAFATQLARSLPAGTGVVVFSFDDRPTLQLRRSTGPDEVAKAAAGLRNQGRFTALNDAIFDAVRTLSEGPGGRRAILVVTDGMDENSALLAEDGVLAAREQRIPVFCVGIGRVHERQLRRIAKLTSGEYFGPGSPAAKVAAQVVEATPVSAARVVAPAGAAAAAAVAPAVAVEPAAAASQVAAPSTIQNSWPILAGALIAVGAVVVALGFALTRRPAAAQPIAIQARYSSSGDAAPAQDDDDTLITRIDLEQPESPTLVLTLKPLLHVQKGPNAGKFFEVSLDTATSIGRAKGNDIVLGDSAVSSQHCRIRPGGGVYEIIDLKSTNGTFLNERRINREKLSAGDLIKIGESVLQFRMDHMKS